jgi:hypothetical protein
MEKAVDLAVEDARTMNGLIENLQGVSPALAQQLEAKPLIASRTPWGVALATLIGLVVARYNIGFSSDTDALLSGLLVMAASTVGSCIMRMITRQPISGILKASPAPSGTPPVALVPIVLALALGACTAAQVSTAVADGQLVCTYGPSLAAMVDPSGAAILAKGQTAAFVRAACAAIGGVPTPATGAPVQTVTITPPAQGASQGST